MSSSLEGVNPNTTPEFTGGTPPAVEPRQIARVGDTAVGEMRFSNLDADSKQTMLDRIDGAVQEGDHVRLVVVRTGETTSTERIGRSGKTRDQFLAERALRETVAHKITPRIISRRS